MKFGMRTPSPKKSFKARTTGQAKRQLKKAVIPGYGAKGTGVIKNPKKAAYNKIYQKTTFAAPGTGGSYRTKTSSTKKGSSSVRTGYSSSNYSSEITGGSSYYSYGVDPVIECKRQILQLESELEHKEKQIKSLNLELFLIPILQFLLCVFVITIPIALIYQGVKKKHKSTLELLELDVLELKINIERLDDELKELIKNN